MLPRVAFRKGETNSHLYYRYYHYDYYRYHSSYQYDHYLIVELLLTAEMDTKGVR